MKIFEPALGDMVASGMEFYGPTSFKKYLDEHGFEQAGAWQYVSVDSLDRLSEDLRDAGVMVFRLGSRPGVVGTHFGLAKYSRGWGDYFLIDKDLLSIATQEFFVPCIPIRQRLAFQLLPKLTETSLVNFAVGTGLLSRVLRIEDGCDLIIPATGHSSFTFTISPRPAMRQLWDHLKGQVEIDALFAGKRDGKDCLFLVEAKRGRPSGTLAKHKLCYPLAALLNEVPESMQVIPVYLKTWSERDGQHFLISECAYKNVNPVIISELEVLSVYHVVLDELSK